MAFTYEEMQEIIECLRGTCKSLDDGVSEIFEGKDFGDMSMDNCYQLDEQIFLCDACGWWYEIGESADDENYMGGQICQNCKEEE